jgi:hypothetical protein
MFPCRANAAAEAVEALVCVRCRKPPLAYFACGADCLCVKVEALDLPEDGPELDVVGTVSRDLGVEAPVVEVEDRLLHHAKEGGVSK